MFTIVNKGTRLNPSFCSLCYKNNSIMINLIERLRKESKISKADLYSSCKVSQGMYYKYLKGSSIPVDVCKSFLDCLGYDLIAVKKDSSIKL